MDSLFGSPQNSFVEILASDVVLGRGLSYFKCRAAWPPEHTGPFLSRPGAPALCTPPHKGWNPGVCPPSSFQWRGVLGGVGARGTAHIFLGSVWWTGRVKQLWNDWEANLIPVRGERLWGQRLGFESQLHCPSALRPRHTTSLSLISVPHLCKRNVMPTLSAEV